MKTGSSSHKAGRQAAKEPEDCRQTGYSSAGQDGIIFPIDESNIPGSARTLLSAFDLLEGWATPSNTKGLRTARSAFAIVSVMQVAMSFDISTMRCSSDSPSS